MCKTIKVVLVILGAIATLGLFIGAASWADASHSQPQCGGQVLEPGMVCDDNGVETTYDEAVQEQENARSTAPTVTAVFGLGNTVNIALWIAQGLLALLYLAAGGLKVVRPREQLVVSGNFDWMKDSSDAGVKAVGLVEILGALGVILPWLTGIAPLLTPIAAIGLVVVQIGALRVHLVRNERQPLPANVLLLLLAAFAAVGRFPT